MKNSGIDDKLINELIDKYTAKGNDARKGENDELMVEYWRIADLLKELLRLRAENKTLDEQREVAVAQTRWSRENTQSVIDASNERLTRAHGILEGVKAMVQSQDGATHRQRDFYANAIVKMIDNTKYGIQPIKFNEDDLPF